MVLDLKAPQVSRRDLLWEIIPFCFNHARMAKAPVRETGHQHFSDSLHPLFLFAFWRDSLSRQRSVNQGTWSLWDTRRKSLAIEMALCGVLRSGEATTPPATPTANGSNTHQAGSRFDRQSS